MAPRSARAIRPAASRERPEMDEVVNMLGIAGIMEEGISNMAPKYN